MVSVMFISENVSSRGRGDHDRIRYPDFNHVVFGV